MLSMDYFGNDKYRVLSCMAQRQISVNNALIVKLSQQDIADIVSLSKVKVNAIIGVLKNDGYINLESPRGKYSLTEKAYFILNNEIGNKGVRHG